MRVGEGDLVHVRGCGALERGGKLGNSGRGKACAKVYSLYALGRSGWFWPLEGGVVDA